jgi:hypothetical protein
VLDVSKVLNATFSSLLELELDSIDGMKYFADVRVKERKKEMVSSISFVSNLDNNECELSLC